MKDFFISYNRADRSWAEWIAWCLERAGYTTVLQAWDFRPGTRFGLDMHRATAECERTIAVFSPDYLTALFTQPEWEAAFVQDPTGEKGTLLPVRVRPCDPPGLLKAIVYLDLVGLDEADAIDRLLAGVQRGRAKPTTAPAFPGVAPAPATPAPRFPGALPPTWNLPLRNANFTGRQDILDGLSAALASGRPVAVTQVITGLGGIGKSQLAVEYAYRHAADYDLVRWVAAEEPAAIPSHYVALAAALNLREKDEPDERVVVEAVLRWLRSHGRWLLVFDNAPDPEPLLPYLPQAGVGHVLITSRHPDWQGLAEGLPLPLMPPAEAVAFLLRRTGLADEAGAAALAEELGYLPLALEQAGAYISEGRKSFSQYLELHQARGLAVMKRQKPPLDYPYTVATTWALAFGAIRKEGAAADLLNLCAFLAPEDIPRALLREGAKHLPKALAEAVRDDLAFDRAVMALRRYSLMEATPEALSLHRLVQAVARVRLSPGQQRAWAEAALRVVNDACPFDTDDVRTWPVCARLLPHALAAADHGEAMGIVEPTGRLFNQMGLYLWGRAQFATARRCFERGLLLAETAYGPDCPNVANQVSNLGSVLQDLDDLAGAKACYERALKIDEAALGPDHPNVGRDVNNLGRVLRAVGDLARAKACFERALCIGEATLGSDHPNVATVVNNLGGLLRETGDLGAARQCYERALRIDETVFSPDHPNVAVRVNNLGLVLRDLGDLAGARACLERALRIDEAVFGPDHPDVARNINNLGTVLRAMGDLAGAKACSERALKIDEAAYGPDHPAVATDVNNLGGVLRDLGDLAGAKGCCERALRIAEAALGSDHPTTRMFRDNLRALGEG